jgi:hypothetical protein
MYNLIKKSGARIKIVQEKLRKLPIRIKIKERVGELNHDETT